MLRKVIPKYRIILNPGALKMEKMVRMEVYGLMVRTVKMVRREKRTKMVVMEVREVIAGGEKVEMVAMEGMLSKKEEFGRGAKTVQ